MEKQIINGNDSCIMVPKIKISEKNFNFDFNCIY